MSRVLIYDSEATEDTQGNDPEQGLVTNEWKRSYPMRCHGGPKGDQRNVSYEFVLAGNPISTAIDLEWYQEFFNDHPWVNLSTALPAEFRQVWVEPPPFPTQRVFPGSGAEYPWAREQVAIAGAAGVIDHYNITRNVASMSVPSGEGADCRYFPMLVHTLWARIAVRTTTALGSYPRLRIYGHTGGIGEVEEYTERTSKPFAWAVPFAE
jgi:hypothetical protein